MASAGDIRVLCCESLCLARIRALLRRPLCIEEEVFEINNLTVDTRTHRVTLESTPVHLARKEFMVLAYLLRNRGSVVTRDMLLEHVWSQEVDPSSNTVSVHIRSLRRKLANGAKPLIHTIAGKGYKIEFTESEPARDQPRSQRTDTVFPA